MTKTDIILKDLNYISNHIKSSLFDAYDQGRCDGFDKGRAYGRADVIGELKSKADCENCECYNCAMSDGDMNCILGIK